MEPLSKIHEEEFLEKAKQVFEQDNSTMNIISSSILRNEPIVYIIHKLLRRRPNNKKIKKVAEELYTRNLITLEVYDEIYPERLRVVPALPNTSKPSKVVKEPKPRYILPTQKTAKNALVRERKEREPAKHMVKRKVNLVNEMVESKEWVEEQIKLFLTKNNLDEIPEFSPGGSPVNESAKKYLEMNKVRFNKSLDIEE